MRLLVVCARIRARRIDNYSTDEIDIVRTAFEQRKRRRLLTLPTSFRLPHGEVELLIHTAKELMDESNSFQQLLTELAQPPWAIKRRASPLRDELDRRANGAM